ncbi:NAD(P)H-dependent oxidoreductase [Salipiger pacificus]|nr:NAD(P)H-dependent oxidoreductase [Alloyangia pacifica]
MHTLIVTAHSDPSSYTHAVVAQLVEGLGTQHENTYEVADLVSEGFASRFGAQDNDHYHSRAEVSADVLAEQNRLDRADVLVLVFPVYWWSMPAVMKGWIDRVFTSGWAFLDDPDQGTTRLLGRLHGQVIAIGGSYRHTYVKRGYLDAMQKQICEGIFGFCGMGDLGAELLLPMDDESAADGLRQAKEIGQDLQRRMSA